MAREERIKYFMYISFIFLSCWHINNNKTESNNCFIIHNNDKRTDHIERISTLVLIPFQFRRNVKWNKLSRFFMRLSFCRNIIKVYIIFWLSVVERYK